jgi:hypothetical protein
VTQGWVASSRLRVSPAIDTEIILDSYFLQTLQVLCILHNVVYVAQQQAVGVGLAKKRRRVDR